jgi:hypothetical protein
MTDRVAGPIPSSVLELLKYRWKLLGGYSAFERVFKGPDDADRKTRPSYYTFRRGKEIETNLSALSHKEAKSLLEEGVFGELAIMRENEAIAINEHAQHALTDFCSEVCASWAKYLSRIEEVKRIGTFP